MPPPGTPRSFPLAAIVDGAEDAVVGLGLDGRITSWNPSAVRIFGYTAAEAIGAEASMLALSSMRPGELAGVVEAIRAGDRVDQFEVELAAKDGSRGDFSVAMSPVRNGDGAVVGVSLIVRDVTARKAGEEVVSRLAAIVDSSDDAIVSITLDGAVESWNAGAEALYGYSAAEMIGRRFDALLPADRRSEAARLLDGLAKGKPVERLESARVRRDGSTVPVWTVVSPIRDLAGRLVGASMSERDLSARKAAERMRNDFIAMLSHDLKNPLSNILGFIELLRDESYPRERRDLFLDRLEANTHAALSLAQNFVDVCRIEGGALAPDRRPTPLPVVVSDVVARNESVARLAGVALRTELAADVPEVPVDVRLVDRALDNLVGNAIKFSPARSTVTIALLPSGDRVRAEVRDQGRGVPPADRGKLFHRFSSIPSGRAASSGLGLFIVRTIAEAHGGEATADFPPEGGSVFAISLPVR